MKLFLAMAICVSMAGCGISVIPLKADGQKSGEVEGVRYYLPKPYLLVVRVPKDAESGEEMKVDGDKKPKPQDKEKPEKPDGDPGGTSGGGNTSFQKDTKTYSVKLIYLPDYCHPMAIQQNTWLWGSSQMKPTLQDGWMLTSLDAASDSKTAETITAMAALVSAVKGAGSGGAKDSGKSLINAVDIGGVLSAGLYEFYQTGGHLSLRKVTTFPLPDMDDKKQMDVHVMDQCLQNAPTASTKAGGQ
jgi:hypothetical protein